MVDTPGTTTNYGWQKLGGQQTMEPGDYNTVLDAVDAAVATGVAAIAAETNARDFATLEQGAPAAKTVTAALSAANLVSKIITTTGATGPSVHQLPTGTLLLAAVLAADPTFAAGDAFDFHVINTGTGASDDATLTVNDDVTIVGNPTVGSLTDATIISGSGHFRARYTTGVTWIVYRLA